MLEATDELLAHGEARWETWQGLVDALGTHQAMELIFVVGAYRTTSIAFRTWRLPAAPGKAPLPEASS